MGQSEECDTVHRGKGWEPELGTGVKIEKMLGLAWLGLAFEAKVKRNTATAKGTVPYCPRP